jgi:hypothetical protein
VDEVVYSAEGCKIGISGTVCYTLIPPRIKKFIGTITISGGGDCPEGSMTFKRATDTDEPITDVVAVFDTDDTTLMNSMYWVSSNVNISQDVLSIINQRNVTDVVVNTIKNNTQQ